MAVITATMSSDNSSDAVFRAWVTQISNAMALAWVQSSDTGQINLSTATRPGTNYTSGGFQIWKMNDSLQTTAPCYVKFEYGTGSSSTNSGMYISIGTGSDGVGNLTGSSGIRIQQGCNSSGVGTLRCSIDTNRLCMYLWYGASNSPSLICIERTHNTSGGDTATGIMCFIAGYYSSNSFVILPGITTTPFAYWNATLPHNLTSNAWASNVFTYPVRTWGQGETSPSNQVCLYFTGDITVLNPIPMTTWEGITRNMLPTGAASTITSFGPVTAQQGIAMRWE